MHTQTGKTLYALPPSYGGDMIKVSSAAILLGASKVKMAEKHGDVAI